MSETVAKKKIVVIGGGSGIHPVLRGLKAYHQTHDITAIVSMADSGGSNARIRDQFGLLPLSDINRGLAALSTDVEDHEQLVRELFLYRFEKGEGVKGHNFGNLLLVALTDLLGSEAEAIKAASRILRVRGKVLPVTTDDIHIAVTYEDGVVVRGEHDIDEPQPDRYGKRITEFWAEPAGQITAEAKVAIAAADLILLGPGDIYSSLLANCVVGGMREALQSAKATFVYAANLMTRPGQTDELSVAGHVAEIVRYVDRSPDVVIVNTSPIPEDLLEQYAKAGQFPVIDDSGTLSMRVVKEALLSAETVQKSQADVLVRSLVRGDATKTAAVIINLAQ